MSSKGREMKRHVEKFLVDYGVSGYTFGNTGSAHQEVRFVHHGRSIRFVSPGSPSDSRAFLNAKCELRKVLRSAEGATIPAAPEARPVLDAGSVLPRKSHDMGSCRAGFSKFAPSLHGRWPCRGSAV
jgi:hypothetical protein